MEKEIRKSNKVRVAITHGDLNGVGYEVILKTFNDPRMFDSCTPVVYGLSKVGSYHKKTIPNINLDFNLIKNCISANPKRLNIINVVNQDVKVDLGESTKEAGEMAFLALEKATEDIAKGACDVLVTAPINKDNIQSDNFDHPGHTEYLGKKFAEEEELMILASSALRVAVVTGHIPVSRVAESIDKEIILRKLRIFEKSLKRDFGIRKPRIAVLGLNPHAGDNGLLGSEENDIIIPAIDEAKEQGILAFGPFAADGFFGSDDFLKFDGILAMYHDQGLTPFKIISFEDGVNFTAGLSIVRTSPDHGTAYEIAGQNKAKPDSFRAAIFMAVEIFNRRKEYDELHANPLKPQKQERNKRDISVDELPEVVEED
jgi:4-hydroxythreonine-4-phosphate dehydrogenase